MSDSGPTSAVAAPPVEGLDPAVLAGWASRQRWYAAKSRRVAGAQIADAVAVGGAPPVLIVLLELRLEDGASERYQLPLVFGSDRSASAGGGAVSTGVGRGVIAEGEGWIAYDALAEPNRVRPLLRAIEAGQTVETEAGVARFEPTEGFAPGFEDGPARPVGVEQSNSSIVFGEQTVLKCFRRLEPGVNPELEVLRFLTRHEFPSIAPLLGAYEYEGAAFAATLGVAQRFLPDATGGWELVLARIGSDPDGILGELEELGIVSAKLHNALSCDPDDPDFAPVPASRESLDQLTAALDEDVERTFVRLSDDESVADIVGRSRELHERIAARSRGAGGGLEIRTHGDFHLGQTLHLPHATHPGWVIIDFEGEPARPLFERRAKRSPLRDVASMLRSLAYAASAASPRGGSGVAVDFEEQARARFLESYLATVDAALLPGGEAEVADLLALFELEKLVYELRYELDNRPDWLPIPVAGIRRLLESE